MGKRSDFQRIERDFYPTPRAAVEPLVPFLPQNAFDFVEPCAGDGRLADHVEDLCPQSRCTYAFDIEPRGPDIDVLDARELCADDIPGTSLIITNPPWDRTKKSGYLLHALIERFSNLAETWLLFDADWMHTRQSTPFIDKYLMRVLSIGRVKWIEDSNMTGKDNVCWYQFKAGARDIVERPRFYGRNITPYEGAYMVAA